MPSSSWPRRRCRPIRRRSRPRARSQLLELDDEELSGPSRGPAQRIQEVAPDQCPEGPSQRPVGHQPQRGLRQAQRHEPGHPSDLAAGQASRVRGPVLPDRCQRSGPRHHRCRGRLGAGRRRGQRRQGRQGRDHRHGHRPGPSVFRRHGLHGACRLPEGPDPVHEQQGHRRQGLQQQGQPDGFDARPWSRTGPTSPARSPATLDTPAVVDGVDIPYDVSGVAPAAFLGNYNVFPGDVVDARSEDILNALDAAYATASTSRT